MQHFLWKPWLPWKRVALSILNDPTTMFLVFGASGFPGKQEKSKSDECEWVCEFTSSKKIDWTILCWFRCPWMVSSSQHFSNFWWIISKAIVDGISMRIWVPRGGRTRAGKGGGLHPFSGVVSNQISYARSSRAGNLTDLRKMSMHVFFCSENAKQIASIC